MSGTSDLAYPFETGDTLSAAALNAALAMGQSNQIRSGAGVPDDATGKDGDMWLDTVAGNLYQRTAGHYAIIANLKGPAGSAGAAGGTGPAGPPGPSSGSVVSVATTGAGISGGPITTTGTLAVQWNAGAVSAIGTGISIAGGTITSTATGGGAPSGAAGGDLAGSYPNPTLATTGVSAGVYGDATHVPVVTVDAKGRLTTVGIATISAGGGGGAPTGPAGGDLSGTYPDPTVASINGVAGPFLPLSGGELSGSLTTSDGIFQSTTGVDLFVQTPPPAGSGDSAWINLETGTSTSGDSGYVSIVSGRSASGTTGGLILKSGPAETGGTAITGDVDVGTGDAATIGPSGAVYIHSGNVAGGNSGNVEIRTGTASASPKKTGDIKLITGTGTSGATRGTITLDAAELVLPSRSVSYAALPAAVQSVPISVPFSGKPATGAIVNVPMAMALTIPAGLAGTTVFDSTQATANAVFTINKIAGGTTTTALGTVTVTPTSKTSATLAGAGGSLAIGDVLQIIAPTQDATLSDIGISILAARA